MSKKTNHPYVPNKKLRYNRTQTGSSGPLDQFIAAKPPGWRMSASGNWYFERRKNRSDTDTEWNAAISWRNISKSKIKELVSKSTTIINETNNGNSKFVRESKLKRWDLYVHHEKFPEDVGLTTETVVNRITNNRLSGHQYSFYDHGVKIATYPQEIKEPALRYVFQIGYAYSDDHYGFTFTVLSRTDKTVTLYDNKHKKEKKYVISISNGSERVTYMGGKLPVYIYANHLSPESSLNHKRR